MQVRILAPAINENDDRVESELRLEEDEGGNVLLSICLGSREFLEKALIVGEGEVYLAVSVPARDLLIAAKALEEYVEDES